MVTTFFDSSVLAAFYLAEAAFRRGPQSGSSGARGAVYGPSPPRGAQRVSPAGRLEADDSRAVGGRTVPAGGGHRRWQTGADARESRRGLLAGRGTVGALLPAAVDPKPRCASRCGSARTVLPAICDARYPAEQACRRVRVERHQLAREGEWSPAALRRLFGEAALTPALTASAKATASPPKRFARRRKPRPPAPKVRGSLSPNPESRIPNPESRVSNPDRGRGARGWARLIR